MNMTVKAYFESLDHWKEELLFAREIILTCDVDEEFKWKHPCYTNGGKNIVLLQEFKDYCAILFPKGSLLKDPDEVLVSLNSNSQSNRQIRLQNIKDLQKLEQTIKKYVLEAISVEKSGLKVKTKETKDYPVPDELLKAFEESNDFEEAFHNLTPGRQRGYLLNFSEPKQAKTRTARIEQSRERIMLGKGLTDCICGHSKHMPRCDGSHKKL